MKLITGLVLISGLFFFGVSGLQADTGTPDILTSLSPRLVQTMSETETAETRGEYRYCNSWTGYCTPWQVTASRTPPRRANYPWINQVYSVGVFYVSR
jgi:hypothetical protein